MECMRSVLNRGLCAVIAAFALSCKILADVPSPDRPQVAGGDNSIYIILGVAFAIGGALLFIWLGRRNAKR